jgi:tetratricopeptide (TPR) repeat protein
MIVEARAGPGIFVRRPVPPPESMKRRGGGSQAAWLAIAAIGIVWIVGAPSARAAGKDPREIEGRTLFRKGDYKAALDVFAALYAQSPDPIYLANIGRCHQMLRHPDEAIDSFRDYLRRAKPRPAEQAEIEGFIREMEALEAAQAPSSPISPLPPATPDAAPPPVRAEAAVPARPAPAAVSPPPAAAVAISRAAPAQSEPRRESVLTTWWFWTAVGAVAAGTVVGAVLVTRPGRPNCLTGYLCGP